MSGRFPNLLFTNLTFQVESSKCFDSHRTALDQICFASQLQALEMAESDGFIPIDKKLSDIFKEAFEFYLHINETSEPTNSPEFQVSHCRYDCVELSNPPHSDSPGNPNSR